MINRCEGCYNLRTDEKKEPKSIHRAAGHAEEHGLLEADHRSICWAGQGSHCRTRTLIVTDTHLKILSGGSRWDKVTEVRAERSSATGGTRLVANTTGRTRTEPWLYKTVLTPARRRCFGPTRHLRVRARTSSVLSNCWLTCKVGGREGQLGGHDLPRFAGTEQAENHE